MVDSSQIPYAIAIDFDGILCQNAYPDIGDPNWDTIHQALKEQSNGAKLILWTCREGRSLEMAVAACAGWGLTFDAVNDNESPLFFRAHQCAEDHAEWEVRRQCLEQS